MKKDKKEELKKLLKEKIIEKIKSKIKDSIKLDFSKLKVPILNTSKKPALNTSKTFPINGADDDLDTLINQNFKDNDLNQISIQQNNDHDLNNISILNTSKQPVLNKSKTCTLDGTDKDLDKKTNQLYQDDKMHNNKTQFNIGANLNIPYNEHDKITSYNKSPRENYNSIIESSLILNFIIAPDCDTPNELNRIFEKAWSDIAAVDENFKFRNWCEMYTVIRPVFTPDGNPGAQMRMKSKEHSLCMKRLLYEKMDYLKQKGWKYWHDNDPEIQQIQNLKTSYMDM